MMVLRIAVSGGKGGAGKSMVSTSLAITLAKQRKGKVLLVDADVECPNDHLIIDAQLKKSSEVFQLIPKWDLSKCTKCGLCAQACKKDAIIFVPGKNPAFVKNMCIGCGACINACPSGAISSSKKKIGIISIGKNHGIHLISGELVLGELASGEIVSDLRSKADEHFSKLGGEVMVIDTPAGIGCPVIASLSGTDYIVAVTEPTPSALHDLKRVVFLAEHFRIKCGIVINKHDLDAGFCREIHSYADSKKIKIIGKIPYDKDFVSAMVKMRPIITMEGEYANLFESIVENLKKEVRL
ncbi:ATP-binding protein [Candidatus Woesearchaeota archaeon]|nr:ATP-binding protein [Candidatus Woesearchaeota archaeon]